MRSPSFVVSSVVLLGGALACTSADAPSDAGGAGGVIALAGHGGSTTTGVGGGAGTSGVAGKAGTAGKGGAAGTSGSGGKAGASGSGGGKGGASGKGVGAGGVAGTGTAGSGVAGSGTAGTGVAGKGAAGNGVGGVAGSGTAGSGVAGAGTAGKGAAGTGAGGGPAGCPCRLDGTDNYCFYGTTDPANAGCAMLTAGSGYCNPDGDGDPGTGNTNWAMGYSDFLAACKPSCGDGHCSAPSECAACASDCAGTPYCATCTPQALACSKLGAQSLDDGGPFQQFLDSCPRVAKWVTGGTPNYAQIAAYKCKCPGSLSVVRMYGPPGTYASGQDLWDARYKVLDGASAAEKASIDLLESDNECDAGHCFGGPSPNAAATADYASFLSSWIDVATAHGFKPLILNISVGNPGGDIGTCAGDGIATFGELVPVIAKAGQAGGAWGYHAYTPAWMQDVDYESYYALRYRRYVGCYPQLAATPLVLTEGGFDKGGNPDADGYLANGGWGTYAPWLGWFGQELNKDAYVKGVALFAFAPAGSWNSFRLDGDVGALVQSETGGQACQ